MTDLVHTAPDHDARLGGPARSTVTARQVWLRRSVGFLVVVGPLVWAWRRAVPGGAELVNHGGLPLLGDLFSSALHPSLDPAFLRLVLDATGTTLAFATLGTAGALVIGLVGGLVLSDVAWSHRPPLPLRLVRLLLRGLLVVVRSIHELVWALLFVSVLGLDPLVAVLAIALPFGAQTAQVFGDTFDGVAPGPLAALRNAGARRPSALAYALLPGAAPLLLSYAFYRFECAIRSSVLLGVVGVGGLGQELVLSLQSRNWEEVWTLVGVVLLLSAAVDLWSNRVRGDLTLVTCSDWSVGEELRAARAGTGDTPSRGPGPVSRSRSLRWSVLALPPAVVVAWVVSDLSWSGLSSTRTRDLTERLLDDLWPPRLPAEGWSPVLEGVADTVAMAVLAMAVAVAVTLVVGPLAARPRRRTTGARAPRVPLRLLGWWLSRALLVTLRSIPPTVWAVVALLVLFPGVLPGALALGLYTGGILGRLVAEAWEAVDPRPRDALVAAGVGGTVAAVAALAPPSGHQLVTYTLYRFEICVRDTAVVGVVGAAGLGRLLAENLAAFRYPVITTLLIASFAVSAATELVSRQLRRALRTG